MSGHNRWSKIKRQKAAMGATKGAAFSKVSKELTVAARIGGGDPAANFRLRAAIDAAKAVNMPSDTIARAVKKGTGELEGASYEELRYEGYGPGGIALVVECLTDNKNRTAGDLRAILTKGGGSLGETNSVLFSFERKGVVEVKAGPAEEAVVEAAIEAGAEDVFDHGADGLEVRCDFTRLFEVAAALARRFPLGEAKARFLPLAPVRLEGEPARKALKLLHALEDCDDVQNVFSNVELDDATLAAE